MFIFFFTGCIARYTEWSNLQTSTFKRDVYISSGQLAAVYDNRIYFAYEQDNTYGIYSMNFDGSNINLEIPTDKIIKIVIADDEIYYIELSYLGEARDERYSLYKYDKENNESVLLAGDGDRESVENVAIIDDDEIYIRQIEMMESSKGPSSHTKIIPNIAQTPIKSVELINIDDSNYYRILIYDKYIITFVEQSHFAFDKNEKLDLNSDDAVYFVDTGETLMWNSTKYSTCDLKVISKNEEYIFLAYSNELIALDKDTLLESYRIKLDTEDSNDKIDYMFENEGLQYLITSLEDSKNTIYAKEPQSTEFNKLMVFDEKTVLINIIDDCILYAAENKVYCKETNPDGLGDVIYTIEFENNIINNNIFEIAGNWLFIYDRGEPSETSSLKLLYRVNLNSKEIIQIKD